VIYIKKEKRINFNEIIGQDMSGKYYRKKMQKTKDAKVENNNNI
jgi:hypothetical protein